jgi:hypothetical protein
MGQGTTPIAKSDNTGKRSKRRALVELGLAYVLILAVIWSPRPLQRLLWVVAVAAVGTITWRSWEGAKIVGLRRENFLRSVWVIGAALAIAAIADALAIYFHTLGLPIPPVTGPGSSDDLLGNAMLFVRTYWGYALWTFVQQFLLQGFFLLRLLRVLPGPKSAALAAAGLFAIGHLPNPILTVVTLIWGFAACMIFVRYRNLYSLAIAHAIFGITIAVTVPGPVIRNMRVGLGYLTYGYRHRPPPSFQPQGPDRVH